MRFDLQIPKGWRAGLLSSAVLLLLVLPAEVLACGGCFSPPAPPVPGGGVSPQTVVQDAERVFFHHDPKTKRSVVWVEVRYSGLAKDFGWVLPLPKQPTVTVGTSWLFDRLDSRMAPKVTIQPQGSENCRDAKDGCVIPPVEDVATSADAGVAMQGDSVGGKNGGPPPGVEVLDHGQTGPYDYIVVKGDAAKPLLDWLDKQGYATPKTAVPIVDSHITKGDVFVAIKLSNGEGVNQIKPIVLEMHDAEPCVPLRLTSIAAAEDMTVVVTIAGPGRAIPKNHLHVRINPMRLNLFKGANNYPQVLSAAIDEAAGRAFVTEYAQQPTPYWSPSEWDVSTLSEATDLYRIADLLANGHKGWLQADVAQIFEQHLKLTELMAVMKPSSPLEAMGYLWACGVYWQNGGDNFASCQPNGAKGGMNIAEAKQAVFETGALVNGMKEGIIDPIYDVGEGIANAKMVTRMIMRISPDEMDRDPVFAFNPTLEPVSNKMTVRYRRVCPNGWLPSSQTRLSVDGLQGSWVFPGNWPGAASNALDPRFKDAPLAMSIELLDESGAPTQVAESDVQLVDSAIQGATPGTPSLPKGITLKKAQSWQPPPSDPPATKVGPWVRPGPWCEPKPGWVDGQLPPTGEVPDPADAGPMNPDAVGGTDAGSLDSGAPAADGTSGGGNPPRTDDDGCSAGPASGPSSAPATGLLLLMGLAVAGIWRRRRVATT